MKSEIQALGPTDRVLVSLEPENRHEAYLLERFAADGHLGQILIVGHKKGNDQQGNKLVLGARRDTGGKQ